MVSGGVGSGGGGGVVMGTYLCTGCVALLVCVCVLMGPIIPVWGLSDDCVLTTNRCIGTVWGHLFMGTVWEYVGSFCGLWGLCNVYSGTALHFIQTVFRSFLRAVRLVGAT